MIFKRLRRRLLTGALITGLMMQPAPARADPLTATFVTWGLSTLAAQVATFVITTAITMGLNKLLSPKVKSNRQAQVQTMQLGEQPRAAVLGECAVGGSLLDVFTYGGKYGTDWEMRIVALADHRCHSLSGYFVNDKYVDHAGDGVAVPGYGGQLKVWFLPGTEDQVLPAELLANCPNLTGSATRSWVAGDNCAGVALFIATYKADKGDAKNPVWSGGKPSFLPVIKGALLYDPRKDSTVPGGSGPHRWADPSTREWDDNLVVARYNWLRGFFACERVDQPDMLLVGRGLSAVEAPPERIFAAANLCDEIAEDGAPRWRVDACIYSTDTFIETEEAFAAACAGTIVQREGGVEVIPGHAQSVVAEITDADLLIDSPVDYEAERGERDDDWVNTVIGRYVEPSMKWADHAAPVRRVVADVVADKKPREETLSLQFVTRVNQAQYAAEYKRRLGRLLATGTIPLGPRYIGLEEGDWIGWTSARRFGGGRKVFQIVSWSFDQTRKSKRVLRQIAASVYAPVTLYVDKAVADQPLPPDFGSAPATGAWAFSGDVVNNAGSLVPTLRFNGAVEDDGIDAVMFEYGTGATAPDLGDDTLWTLAGTAPSTVLEWTVAGVDAAPKYWGAVSYSSGGTRSDRVLLGPVTFDLGAIAPPSPSTPTLVATTVDSAQVASQAPFSTLFRKIRFFAGPTSNFADAVAISDLLTNSPGYVFQITETGVAAGPRWYWTVAYGETGAASAPAGPLAVNLGAFDFSGSTLPAGAALTRSGNGWLRNSSGVVTLAAADVARFGYRYNMATSAWERGGLLVEGAASNLALQSQNLPTTWTKVAVTTPSATRMIETSAASTGHYVSQSVSFVSGTTYCLSADTGEVSGSAKRYLILTLPSAAFGTNRTAKFDLATGTIPYQSSGVTPAMIPAGAGRWICTITAAATATVSSSYNVRLADVGNTSALTYTGDGTSGLDVTNIQFETDKRTSSIVTTTATVTRPADVLTLDWSTNRHLADGTITVRYTFDDGSTQDVSTTIASGHSTVPTTLNRAFIKKVERV
jgi:hypothetical protein